MLAKQYEIQKRVLEISSVLNSNKAYEKPVE